MQAKYPSTNSPILDNFRTTYDSAPLGGFGGMGIVQLMVPPGDNSDGTNTALDDNIIVFQNGSQLNGTGKQAILAWRGFPNSFGQGVDDNGNVINIGNNEGDIRPSPTLLPTPFSNRSRLRSVWIDTGATARRPLPADDNLPRGIVVLGGAQAGPRYEWAGAGSAPGIAQGYANYVISQGAGVLVYPTVIPATGILATNANASFLGRPAFTVQLNQAALGTTNDRYVQYTAELLASAASTEVLASYRILSHTANQLVLATDGGPLPTGATHLRVRAKFFEVFTNGEEGLGPTYPGSGGSRVPISNLRFGFAFHQNPQDPSAQRYPAAPGTYAYDLSDPAVQEAVRALGAPFVQWDIVFDTAFRSDPADQPPALNPETPLPELRYLRLPFRF